MDTEIICRVCLNLDCDKFVPMNDVKGQYSMKVKELAKVEVNSANQAFFASFLSLLRYS